MSEPPPTTQRKSRVLAALDNPALFLQNPTTTTIPMPPASLGLPQTPMKPRLATPTPAVDFATVLGLTGLGPVSSQKRKASGPENDLDYLEASGSSPSAPRATPRGGRNATQFGLHYDTEGAVLSIDRGGDDQQLKCVLNSARHSLSPY